MHDEHEALLAGLEAWGADPNGAPVPSEAIDAMDEHSLRPLRDMAAMPWIRAMTYRTVWSTASGLDSAFIVTVSANATHDSPGVFGWIAEGMIAGERVALAGQACDSPIVAYAAAQRAIVEWFNGN